MNKRGFSLIEVLVSIGLFSIILVFLYDALDMTTKSNKFYSKQLEVKKNKNHIKNILFLDFANKKDLSSTIIEDRDRNNIISFQTNNTYHNPFYTNVTYLLSREHNLIRIESKKKFNKEKLDDAFFESSYFDILDNNITKLKIQKNNQKYFFYIENVNKNKILFSF